ncbi:hypothetical protein [Caryophanon tenue]|uniref:DUF2273 domain-containing protein n=1 Tax=Caryophanon tenue TaxID=33978 RepID=A0A1C0YIX2_9BACL|nr:hypothetical protein [Caryophanon tenue]OCS87117.1 hypothetical protein A6M13_11620 [Caryophanon tenue]
MERTIRQLLMTYKWAIICGLSMFIFCILVAAFNVWIALLIVALSLIAGCIGYMKDAQLSLNDLLRTFKFKS